ncbi:MAG: hypothetical protein IPK04_05245 [Bdellovibrionales bacterium]|nr:hypothetical protein [Bdellovibrionales bacterium]
MPLQQFLQSCVNDLIQQPPVQVVGEVVPGQYMYVAPDEFEVAWIDPENPAAMLPAPTQVTTKTLKTFSVPILNGGNVVNLDYNFLSKQRNHILRLASSWIGAACFDLARTVHQIQFQPLTSVTQIDTSLANLSRGSTPDVTVMCNPTGLLQIKRNFLNGRVSYQKSGRMQTENIMDFTNPIFHPVTKDSGLLIFEWFNSFVLASPALSVSNNRLIFEFKADIADPTMVIGLQI